MLDPIEVAYLALVATCPEATPTDAWIDALSVRDLRVFLAHHRLSARGLVEKAEFRAAARGLRDAAVHRDICVAMGRVPRDPRRPLGNLGIVSAPIDGCRYEKLMNAGHDFGSMSVRRLRNYIFVAHAAGCDASSNGPRPPTLEVLGNSPRALVAEAARCRRQLVEAWNLAYYAATCTKPSPAE